MKEKALLYFFVFFDFTVSPIFSCFIDFTARQIGHLYKSTFISSQYFFYSKCKGNTNNPITNQGAGFRQNGMILQQNDFVFSMHFDSGAGMIPLFRQSTMNSVMITLHYRHVKVWMMVKRKSNYEYFQHSGSPLNLIISQKRYCFQQSRGFKKSKIFRTLGSNHAWACGGHCCS